MAAVGSTSNDRAGNVNDEFNVPPGGGADAQQRHAIKNNALQHPDAQGNASEGMGSTDTRETTKTVEQDVAERMAADPEAKRINDQLARATALANDWAYVDNNTIGRGDGQLSLAAINEAAKDPCQTQEVRDAANRLLANPDILRGFNKDDSLARTDDVYAFIEGLQAKVEALRAKKTEEVKQERGIGTNPQAGVGGATPNGAPLAPGSEPAASVPLPPPSEKPGMEGAMENMGNMADYYSKQMLAIANDTTIDPAKKTALISDLQTKQQATMNMLNQLIQMMQNTSKLWSDIAMNSVRNIK